MGNFDVGLTLSLFPKVYAEATIVFPLIVAATFAKQKPKSNTAPAES